MWKKMSFESFMGVILLAAVLMLCTTGLEKIEEATPASAVSKSITIVIDAGHGGDDPGKIGVNDAKEKDINLAISNKLKALLEAQGINVVMTRENDDGLYDASSSNKKQDDMKKRCEKIDAANPVFTVSIHQNSYTQESVHGPQVFYFSQSAEGEAIASAIQDALNEQLQVDRAREIKGNDTYYLLKKTQSPTVIVECGFLSNNEEAAKLVTEEYQDQVAEAICVGVMECLE